MPETVKFWWHCYTLLIMRSNVGLCHQVNVDIYLIKTKQTKSRSTCPLGTWTFGQHQLHITEELLWTFPGLIAVNFPFTSEEPHSWKKSWLKEALVAAEQGTLNRTLLSHQSQKSLADRFSFFSDQSISIQLKLISEINFFSSFLKTGGFFVDHISWNVKWIWLQLHAVCIKQL